MVDTSKFPLQDKTSTETWLTEQGIPFNVSQTPFKSVSL